uniref:Nucleotide-diphospho-sugar transferase domain-containing protein n=1 Tax=Eutreptiella gymnastica TaxID=73025 RepID=A0A7S4G4W6_9EUGL
MRRNLAVLILVTLLANSLNGLPIVRGHKGRCLQSKNESVLLYTVLGQASQTYYKMLDLMVAAFLNTTLHPVHVMVLAHESWRQPMLNMGFRHQVVLVNDSTYLDGKGEMFRKPMAPALKMRVFDLFPSIFKYDIVIFSDVDIVVNTDILSYVGPLHSQHMSVVGEGFFNDARWSVRTRDAQALSELQARHIKTFSTGFLVFRPSSRIAQIFEKAYASYTARPRGSVYEQGHLVDAVVDGIDRLSYTLTNYSRLGLHKILQTGIRGVQKYALWHAAGNNLPSEKKLDLMETVVGWGFPKRMKGLPRCGHT